VRRSAGGINEKGYNERGKNETKDGKNVTGTAFVINISIIPLL
jgi:hypothetical protein